MSRLGSCPEVIRRLLGGEPPFRLPGMPGVKLRHGVNCSSVSPKQGGAITSELSVHPQAVNGDAVPQRAYEMHLARDCEHWRTAGAELLIERAGSGRTECKAVPA